MHDYETVEDLMGLFQALVEDQGAAYTEEMDADLIQVAAAEAASPAVAREFKRCMGL